MRNNIEVAGLVLAAEGISGAIDRVAVQPFMAIFLNFFNRVVVPRIGFLTGYELYANLALAALGIMVVIAAAPRSP
ncbi:hypothetical protein ABZT47_16500 [Sphaerisporangium sp. NPDC005289]|uniref:hypothetical protein n=1 Tax=Sphaerisporangium sp. NPDC005289 TaxID=3155247 RepID=UPI0033A2BB3B